MPKRHKPYRHTEQYTVAGAHAALVVLFERTGVPESVLDLGCGVGTWLAAAIELGVRDLSGFDATERKQSQFAVNKDQVFQYVDFKDEWSLERKYDLIMCMETAEHLNEVEIERLIENACNGCKRVLFSAALPGQGGQGHLSCKWPWQWQEIFNRNGFRCDDWIRWAVWNNPVIEPWYRQNMFVAEPGEGREPRLKSVIHPELWLKRQAPGVSSKDAGTVE